LSISFLLFLAYILFRILFEVKLSIIKKSSREYTEFLVDFAVLLECVIYAMFFLFQRKQILQQRKKQALVEEEI